MNETASKLLDIAERLIRTRGYNAFSYGDLAAELGIKTASIHYHFPSKTDLVLAVTDRYRKKMNDGLNRIVEERKTPPERLRAYLDMYSHGIDGGKNCVGGMLAAEMATLPEPVKNAAHQLFTDNERWLAVLFRDGRNSGTLNVPFNTELKARSFYSAVQGALIMANAVESEERFVAIANELYSSALK